MTPEITTPPATPQETQPGTSPSRLNEVQLISLTKAEEICRTVGACMDAERRGRQTNIGEWGQSIPIQISSLGWAGNPDQLT